jgi:hypothetical protein
MELGVTGSDYADELAAKSAVFCTIESVRSSLIMTSLAQV